MSVQYLSLLQVAERLGVTRNTIAGYKLPEPDAFIGTTRGWLPETIDAWDAARPRKRRVPRPVSE
ncbi:helix-turn-helix transcriptional regulator [Timonella sp. A28]|uniref:helix-turn-helix transcriptional regulator n=1 Tax=Timonella sp. A28 TaxID=3442640 RepID=UPI003EBB16FA